jgi:hypothetical protein
MWRLKVATQAILARLPFGEQINHLLQRIRMGLCGGLDAAIRKRVRDRLIQLRSFHSIRGATIVEIGTGWDAFPTLMLSIAGAERIYSYDNIRHLRHQSLRAACRVLAEQSEEVGIYLGVSSEIVHKRTNNIHNQPTLDAALNVASIAYVAPGDGTQTGLPAHSVDMHYPTMCWSTCRNRLCGI